jgi:excisionase family DNA binding protein
LDQIEMTKAEKDILTTADTARLLGVSVRTAQLLIEGGSIESWKTPGGHRRVYRADVMALIGGGTRSLAPLQSVAVVVVASAARLTGYEAIFADLPECTISTFEDEFAAMIAVGSIRPHAVIIDVEEGGADRRALLRSLVTHGSVAGSHLIAVGGEGCLPPEPSKRMTRVDTPVNAADVIRSGLRDSEDIKLPSGDFPFPIGPSESQRLVALERSGLLDTPPEEAFDRLTWLAAETLQMPIALLTLLTRDRQWFKSRIGLDVPETPRGWAFCNHTIMQKRVFSVEDLASDPRFVGNPAVAGQPGFRFYAGAPVLDGDGFVVGTLCVIDHKPRTLDERGAQTIQALAALATNEIRLRALDRKLRDANRERTRRAHAAARQQTDGAED